MTEFLKIWEDELAAIKEILWAIVEYHKIWQLFRNI